MGAPFTRIEPKFIRYEWQKARINPHHQFEVKTLLGDKEDDWKVPPMAGFDEGELEIGLKVPRQSSTLPFPGPIFISVWRQSA